MAEFEKINSARLLLKSGLEKSKEVASALDKTGSRLRGIDRELSHFEDEVRPREIRYGTVSDQIECLVGPIAAVSRVYRTVHELGSALSASGPREDLFGFAADLKRLEEGLGFLSSNCELASLWLEDVLRALENEGCFLDRKLSLGVLVKLREMDGLSRLGGGPISCALDKIEDEFSRILSDETHVIPIEGDRGLCFPGIAILKLQTAASRLEANARHEKCASLFVEARVSDARRSLSPLGLDYLEAKIISDEDPYVIERWGQHLEAAVKQVFDHEHELCERVFERSGASDEIFARVAVGSGVLSFLRFGTKVLGNMKREPGKLLKLLDMFRVLNDLRPDFSRIFNGSACSEIRGPTRELVKKLVEESCEIFTDLAAQVALQRRFSSPPDGSVPKLVRFVTGFCNTLLGDEYASALTEVLTIQKKWNGEPFGDDKNDKKNLLWGHLRGIMWEVGANLDEWCKAYADVSLSYLFMMNSHCHLCGLSGTRLGDSVMGPAWLSAHAHYRDHYAGLYLKESWVNILPFLTQKRLEERLERHSKWVISDDRLRQTVRDLLVQTVAPAYTNDRDGEKSLETKLSSLFQPSLVKYNRYYTHARFFGRLKTVVANKFSVAPS